MIVVVVRPIETWKQQKGILDKLNVALNTNI